MKDNPELGDRGCAALAKRPPAPLLYLDWTCKVRLRAADGFALADELCFQFSVEKAASGWGQAPEPRRGVVEKPRPAAGPAAPPFNRAVSGNFELGNDAINRLAYVAERSKYRLGVECSSDRVWGRGGVDASWIAGLR